MVVHCTLCGADWLGGQGRPWGYAYAEPDAEATHRLESDSKIYPI